MNRPNLAIQSKIAYSNSLIEQYGIPVFRKTRAAAIACFAGLLGLVSAGDLSAQSLDIGSSSDFLNAIQTINSDPGNAYTLNFINGFAMTQQAPDLSSTSTITLNGNANTIDGGNQFQPLIVDSGTVILQSLNTINPGQAVMINGGTLIDTTGSLQGPVVNNGAVQFFQTLIGEYVGNMSGTGTVEINSGADGGGEVIFSGTNSYTGGTIVDAGSTLSGTTDSLQGNINNSWLLQFNQTTNGTYAGVISGNGGVEISGGGTITFTGLNTYSGATEIDHGSALVGTTSTVQGDLIDNGAVQFNQGFTGVYAGNITGTGSVEIAGGPVTFSGINAYTGGTTVDGGSLLVGTTDNLQGAFTNNGFVEFNQAVAGTYGGDMTGAGGVEISGVGPITFSGTNSYTGLTLVDSGSTLIGTTSGVQGDIVNGGAVQFNQSSAGTYSGQMIGAGSVEISGVGPVTFTGFNTYSGGTTIDSGSTLVGTTDSLQGSIFDNGLVQFNQSAIGGFFDNISGTGSVEISGVGPIVFLGVNTYSGGTTVDSGSTLIGTTDNLQGAFSNNGAVHFNQSAAGTYSGNMSGTGSIEISGGPVTFSGINSYSGGTTVDINSMLIGTTDSLQGAVTNDGVVQFSQASAGTYSGNMTGSGGVEISAAGPVTFTGLNTYSGGTLIDNGSTLIGTTDSLQGTIYNHGAIQFNQSLTGTYAGNMSGAGSVEIGGSGIVTFSGTNTYTGGTTIDGGSSLIGTTTSLQGSIVNNGALQFNQTTDGSFASNITGNGTVEISGAGTVTLAGLNTYSGGTTVDSGSTVIGTTDSVQGQFLNFGSVQFNQVTNGTYAGNMFGSGSVAVGGGGQVTFSGTNSYSGGTTVDNISALIGTTSSLQGSMVINGALAFNQATNGTFAGDISGAGLVELVGGASIIFSGTNSYTGGTILGAETTLIGTTSSLTGPISDFGLVQFKQSTSGTYSDVISNGGMVEISGAGPITFTGANTYTGGTIVDSGSTLIGSTTSVQGIFTNNGTVQFLQSIAGTYADGMTGTGGVEISGGGTLTFLGTNTYSGGTIVDMNNGLIGTTSSLQGAFVNNGTLQFNQSTSGQYAGNISGGGSVEVSGGGTILFSGTNTYTGGTIIDAGSGLIASVAGIQGAVSDNGSLQLRQNANGNFTGDISGTGSVEISGPLTLSGTNSYSGGTLVDSGALLIGNTFGVQGDITNNGVVKFNPFVDDGSVSIGILGGSQPIPNIYAGSMSGTGSVEIASGPAILFTGLNSYSGGTTVDSGGALWGTTASIQGDITNNGIVIFSNTTTAQTNQTLQLNTNTVSLSGGWVTPATPIWSGIYSGDMSGSGGVEIDAGGMVLFSGTNSYSGGTVVDATGTLIGTSSSLHGAIVNNGFVQFFQGSAGSYAGNMSGTGGVEISGGGPVTFSGLNSYSGGTTVDAASTLIGTTKSLQGLIADYGHVTFNQTTSGTFAGSISGTGGVEIAGIGPVTFSGINTYTGGTTIDNGSTLNVTGSIAGDVAVNSGGTLAGSGTFGNLTINAGGTIAPGTESTPAMNISPGGTLGQATVAPPVTVNGNYLQSTGSTYSVEVNPTASDQIVATGTATIQNGTTLNISADAGAYTIGTTYDILKSTGALTGTYSSILQSGSAQNVIFTEQYGPHDLFLTVNSNLAPAAQTANQAGVAAILDQASGSATGSLSSAITQLTALSSSQLSGALSQVAGDIYPSLSTIQQQTTTVQMTLLSNRLAGLTGPGVPSVSAVGRKSNIRLASQSNDARTSDTTSAEPSLDGPRWTTWAQGYGLGGNISGDGNAGSTNYRLGGTLFGVENWLSENMMVGVLGGYTGTSVNEKQDGSSAQINSYQVGLYELVHQDAVYFSNVDSFTNNNYNVSRPISAINQTASASSSGSQYAHYSELGTTLPLDDIRVQPFAGVQYMYLDQRGYTESGAGALDLTTGSQTVNSIRSSLGARASMETVWRGVLITPTLSARYQHEFGNGTQLVTSSLSGAPSSSFVVSGNHTGRDFGIFSFGATAFFTENISLFGSIDTQAAQSYSAVIGSGGVQYSW